MRQIELPETSLKSSVLGMGCASLGSRYGARAGLQALEAAFDSGITWFDVAPAYGAGEAEPILGRFLQGRREHVHVCTKVGLAAPHRGVVRKLLLPLARPVVARLKGLRGKIRQSGTTKNVSLPLSAELIETSITRSLARLRTDRVEVFALHDPNPDDLARDDVLRALERVVARGQARHVAVAGELDAALRGAASQAFAVIQTADDPLTDPLPRVRTAANRPIATISHSVLGTGGTRAQLAAKIAQAPGAHAQVEAAGFEGSPSKVAAQLLLARAFHANGNGPVLASMFGAGHLQDAVAATVLGPSACEKAHSLVKHLLEV